MAEHLLRGGVEFPDVQLLVHRDDGIVSRLENRTLPGFALDARAVDLVGEVQRR
jgi:hypothetical protein